MRNANYKVCIKVRHLQMVLPELDPEVDQDEVFSHLGNVQNKGVTKICLFVWLVYKSTKNAFGRRYLGKNDYKTNEGLKLRRCSMAQMTYFINKFRQLYIFWLIKKKTEN